MRKVFFRFWALQMVLATTAACMPAAGFGARMEPELAAKAGQALRGRVMWPAAARPVQATIGDIALAATVSLIDTSKDPQLTVATTVTDAEGFFQMSLPGFSPAAGRAYILEAVKGLGGQNLGADAPRLRTLIRSEAGTWQSMHGQVVTISPSSTALALMQSGYATNNDHKAHPHADPGNYIGIITAVGDPYDTVGAMVDVPAYRAVVDIVRKAIDAGADPVASTTFDGASFIGAIGSLPTVSGAFPAAGSFPGSRISVYGRNLSNPTGVTIGGKACTTVSSSVTSIVLDLPFDATTGPVVVSMGPVSSDPFTYTILEPVTGRYKPAN